MKSEFKEYFKKLLGEENAHFDSIHQRAYSYDATRKHYLPDGVLFPRNEEDISEILKYCNEKQIIIIPRGSGSGFTGGALAVNGGLILSFEKHMNQILEIDLENLVAVVQPGVINIALQKEVAKHKLFYPPDPASMEYSSLGGNVSENAGGMRAAKYGITKDYVMALRAVLANGDIIRAGKRTIKDVAGYNLAGILIASEGSLAVLSELTLKLIPMPKLKKTAFATFASVKEAMNAVYKSLAGGVNPVSMEFLDNLSIRAVEEKFHKGLNVEAGAILICDVDGNVKESVEEDLKYLREHFLEAGAMEFKIAQNESEAADIWFARRNCSQSIAIYGTLKLNEDITVPRSKLPELLEGIEQISQKYGFKIPCFGHTGDGNVHTNVMVKDKNDKEQVKKGYEAVEEIFKLAVGLGGTLSGEHGIGISKAPFMNLAFSEAELDLMRNIKKAFDPNNILNPFKMGL
ncbi:FAD-linked oxidase C-terminal domain-containing protein [Campylobacter upsaliensis]|uniref:FAD-linked oxidase C-terminal domain-containing protein n=1 Tax=Campylobacter upsaliensis TaxID=28080 RepID=UPI0022EACD34|nr:FAD-linked oxidase C-terminal domain-containing protein [Campylobacter upsaliensis]MEB2804364.1 FAD-linked oxidase C-terminal domain-containing protein [Campylobacter upsaliensis]MEB2812533.1 FAD-linked oxidase C-terminal domain-containing protein [Campylobacter upsaliensis]MEB2817711.1 FAD-linked oxidase C-terminal domain-containing protein [Campylobacter upsaliensis]MEB2823574.1 FAD-linked oxidase C-terminal domain-containing protein [Campylobacter upsaliensis]